MIIKSPFHIHILIAKVNDEMAFDDKKARRHLVVMPDKLLQFDNLLLGR